MRINSTKKARIIERPKFYFVLHRDRRRTMTREGTSTGRESINAYILIQDGEVPLKLDLVLQQKCAIEPSKPMPLEAEYIPTIREFPKAMKRLLTNWLLTCNNLSGVFYVLGASAYITFLAKYLEVQYSTSAAGGTVIAGTYVLIYVKLH